MEVAEVACAFESGDSYFHPGSSRIFFVFVKWERMRRHRMLGPMEGRGRCRNFVIFCHLYSAAAKFSLHMAMDSNRTSVSCGERLASWRYVEK